MTVAKLSSRFKSSLAITLPPSTLVGLTNASTGHADTMHTIQHLSGVSIVTETRPRTSAN